MSGSGINSKKKPALKKHNEKAEKKPTPEQVHRIRAEAKKAGDLKGKQLVNHIVSVTKYTVDVVRSVLKNSR